MNKSYYQHCTEERDEAKRVLQEIKDLVKDHVTIICLIPPSRKLIISVHPRKLRPTLRKLKRSGKKVLSVKKHQDIPPPNNTKLKKP